MAPVAIDPVASAPAKSFKCAGKAGETAAMSARVCEERSLPMRARIGEQLFVREKVENITNFMFSNFLKQAVGPQKSMTPHWNH